MNIIKNEDIEKGLNEKERLYLCGNLKFPNGVEHIPTEKYEIGISKYCDYNVNQPHYHSYNTEYNYVLEGEIKILLIGENKEFHFKKGDLFVINPFEEYVCKCLGDTKILFSKVPGGNDKVKLAITEEIKHWGRQWTNNDAKEVNE